jgi:hypothetical protein
MAALITLFSDLIKRCQHTEPELFPSFSASLMPNSSFWTSVLMPGARNTALLIPLPP